MSEKLPPISEIQKLAAENGVELTDEMLDAVAGGAYSTEEWNSMNSEERKAAQQRSLMAKFFLKIPCEMD